MALISLSRDAVPAWAKIDLQLHQPYRTWLGFGRLRCDWCGERWGRHGCYYRESAARHFLDTASPAQREAALLAGDISTEDLRPRRRTRLTGAHRRRPSPFPAPALVPRLLERAHG
ncbi:hypothetical protein [Glycomyces terrestris]|uniref:Uncharacterized protein n=1 Tax=Glycomyces terrestris TaxID=2493553 RepID=A0A426USL7_9ACTN|nr:hypothetical protein [Glycomyces terrestris]RRR96550.1 hypothetical protein EIW28_22230 [Glycomyces terrestris]